MVKTRRVEGESLSNDVRDVLSCDKTAFIVYDLGNKTGNVNITNLMSPWSVRFYLGKKFPEFR